MIDAIVMIAPELSLEPERMHRWRVQRPSITSAVHTCLRRFKRHATKGKVYRITAFTYMSRAMMDLGKPAPAVTRRVRF